MDLSMINIGNKVVSLLKSRKGGVFPLALTLLLTGTALAYTVGKLMMDMLYDNNNRELEAIAQREAENSLVWGVWALNTPVAEGGVKTVWTSGSGEHQIDTIQTDKGYIVKRSILMSYPGPQHGTDVLMGIAKIYPPSSASNSNIKIAEKRVSMEVDINNPSVVKMYKDSWQTVK